jgi:hypothetical protein
MKGHGKEKTPSGYRGKTCESKNNLVTIDEPLMLKARKTPAKRQ